MLGHELLASALYINGLVLSETEVGIDGFAVQLPFLHKYVGPLLSIESKGAKHLAWCLTQVLAFFGLVNRGCEVADVHKNLTKHFYHYFSDQVSRTHTRLQNSLSLLLESCTRVMCGARLTFGDLWAAARPRPRARIARVSCARTRA